MAAAATRFAVRLLTTAIHAHVGLSRHAILGLRRTLSPPPRELLARIAGFGILRYRGSRGGCLTRAHRLRWLKGGLPESDAAIAVPNGGHPSSKVVRASVDVPTTRTPTPPTLYVFNAASLAKPDAIEQLTSDLLGYAVDIAIICETHLKTKHADSCVSIDNYNLFRCDRKGRKGGGVAIYIRRTMTAAMHLPSIAGNDPYFELLWVKVTQGCDITFVGALYHPPKPLYATNVMLPSVTFNTTTRTHISFWRAISINCRTMRLSSGPA